MSSSNKEAIAISDLNLIVHKNITIIKCNNIEERQNGTKVGSGLQHNKIFQISHIQCHNHS